MTDGRHVNLETPKGSEAAVAHFLRASMDAPVVVFKKSPICPVSSEAESRFESWLETRTETVNIAMIDVIAERELARGLTAALNIQHESPQVLVFKDGAVSWQGSHGGITGESLTAAVDGA